MTTKDDFKKNHVEGSPEYKSITRHEKKEAKRAKIKESLEALLCSNLLEPTKVEILESIRNYLVD